MPSPEVRYCTTEDGVRIAYSVEGEGPVVVVFPYMFSSFTLEHLWPDLQANRQLLGRGRTLVRYDRRGVGASADATDLSHEALVRDVEAVAEAVGARGLYLYAGLTSVPIAIEFAVLHPEAVAGLVLTRPIVRGADAIAPDAVDAIATLAESRWSQAAQLLADFSRRRDYPQQVLQMSLLFERSATGECFARMLRAVYETTDVSARLAQLNTPTLVVYWGSDSPEEAVAYDHARDLAAGLPAGRLVRLERRPLVEPQILHDVLDSFIPRATGAHVAQAANRSAAESGIHVHQSPIRTILFTDLVGHTEMMQRLGDEQGRAVLREHERITRETLAAHDGDEVKTMGDGFMASFGSVTKALDCAIALQRAFASVEPSPLVGEGLGVRAGLNAGEPIAEDGDLFGSTVILASRICGQAGAGEILIPEPVRHLLAGKSYVYADRGEVLLKGFEDAVRLYEVRWRA
jgi:class 3 adenylate cyclase/pimeloyl-ACP methyl ester carboxylesterase